MTTFSTRLEECAAKVGSKVKLAEQAGISFSQLMRYMNGSSKPTVPRLMALADAARVTPGWLLSGFEFTNHSAGQVVLEKTVFIEVLSRIDEVLLNSQRRVSAQRKALFIYALCKTAEHLDPAEQEFLFSEPALNDMLDFMSAYQDGELDEFYAAIEGLSHEAEASKIARWTNLICRGHLKVYDTEAGQRYFDRMLEVEGAYASEIRQIIGKVEAMNENFSAVLDLGCGNGRHLKYVHEHFPHLRISGVDTSTRAIEACQHLESRGALPAGTAQVGDMRQLPYENHSFDLVWSRYSLFCCPLTQDIAYGLDKVFAEVHRVLKPGGIFHATTRRGTGLNFYAAQQLLDVTDVQALAQRHGFDVVGLRLGETNVDLHKDPADKVHQILSHYLSFQLVKLKA